VNAIITEELKNIFFSACRQAFNDVIGPTGFWPRKIKVDVEIFHRVWETMNIQSDEDREIRSALIFTYYPETKKIFEEEEERLIKNGILDDLIDKLIIKSEGVVK